MTTEDSLHNWPGYPYRLDGAPNWDYPVVGDRRKVIAWSKTPWDEEAVGSHDAVRGRLVSGSTNGVNVVGVCIPWQQSHVSTGRRDRSNWEDHRNYLHTLAEVLAERDADSPTIVAGDFNQRLPRTRQPIDVHAQLMSALDNYEVATAGEFGIGTLIDHIAASDDFVATDVETWPRHDGGVDLSDHSGVAATLVQVDDPDSHGGWVTALMETPTRFGLRGDPFLWSELRAALALETPPRDRYELEVLLHRLITESTGVDLLDRNAGDSAYVSHFPDGGMSGGHISVPFWRDEAIPLILQRFDLVGSRPE